MRQLRRRNILTTALSVSFSCLLACGDGATTADPPAAVWVNLSTQSDVLTAEGQTTATGTGALADGVLLYQLEYVIDIPLFGAPTILRANGIIEDGAPPTGQALATACIGQPIICDPITLNEWSRENFVSGGPLSETGMTILTTPPSASGNSSATTWTITPVAAEPVPVTLSSYSELLSIPGTTVGVGTGELVNGVLTYEMELLLEVEGFDEKTTIAVHGALFDGPPPTGVSAISACEGLSFICNTAELDTFRLDRFESGGPISETDVTILTTGPSASGNTGPSELTIRPAPADDRSPA